MKVTLVVYLGLVFIAASGFCQSSRTTAEVWSGMTAIQRLLYTQGFLDGIAGSIHFLEASDRVMAYGEQSAGKYVEQVKKLRQAAAATKRALASFLMLGSKKELPTANKLTSRLDLFYSDPRHAEICLAEAAYQVFEDSYPPHE